MPSWRTQVEDSRTGVEIHVCTTERTRCEDIARTAHRDSFAVDAVVGPAHAFDPDKINIIHYRFAFTFYRFAFTLDWFSFTFDWFSFTFDWWLTLGS